MADNADKPKDETKGDRKGGGGGGSKTLLIIIIAGFLMFMILAGAGFYHPLAKDCRCLKMQNRIPAKTRFWTRKRFS